MPQKILGLFITVFLIIFSTSALATQKLFNGTILFENGSGVNLKEWTENKEFVNCAKLHGRLFFYDRLIPQKPIKPSDINHYLVAQLKLRKIKPPYILVAHSYGAMYSMYFARKNPDLVKGILLVDPVPNNFEWLDNVKKQKKPRTELRYQLLGFEQTKKQINSLPPLSDKIPVIIMSSSDMEKNAPIKGDWEQQQIQWLNRNSNSQLVKIDSGHFIQLEHPELVCEQIKTLVDLSQ